MTLSTDSQLKGEFIMSATSATIAGLDGHQDLAVPIRTAEVTTSEEAEANALEAIYYPITQRDPNDVRTILRLAVSALAFAALSLALAGLLTYKLTRSPALVVVERTAEGDRVVGDDLRYTLSGRVQIRPDRPGDGDKKYAAAKWAESFFQIDPQTRRADIVRGLKMMTPDAAVALVDQVKQSGEWETQRREEWQTVWKPQLVSVSHDDPYKIEIVGQQEISKTIGGVTQHASRQLMFTLALRADTAKRTEDNQNTGFRIAGIVDMRILAEQPGTAAATGSSNVPTISVAPPQSGQ
jgi:hypothetical protein